MKKKIIAVILTAATMAALYGCGSDKNTETQASTTAQTKAETAEETQTSAETAAETEAGDDYIKGTTSAEGFESQWLNLKFTPAEDDIMATEEEIAAMLGTGTETVQEGIGATDEQMQQTVNNTVCEMMASKATGSPNVQIMVEKVPMGNMTAEQYLDVVKAQLESLDMGYTSSAEYTAKTIAGQEYTVLKTEASTNGVDFIQEYATRKQGNRLISFIMTYTGDTAEAMDTMLGQFTTFE